MCLSRLQAKFKKVTKSDNLFRPVRNRVHQEIVMDQALREVTLKYVKSPKACPLLIHHSPKARKRTRLGAKLHWNAVTPDHLTKSLVQARDDS